MSEIIVLLGITVFLLALICSALSRIYRVLNGWCYKYMKDKGELDD